MIFNKRFYIATAITGLVMASIASVTTAIAADSGFSSYVDAKGSISFPKGFRTSMVHLGSWYVPEGGASGFHDVYTEKESVEVYRKTGEFPDGATLVKELRASKSGDYSTGPNVSHATPSIKQWFVMVKDSKSRFKENDIWGDGWGWALFKPDKPNKNVATDYKKDCLGCHVPVKASDWVYVEGYPALTN